MPDQSLAITVSGLRPTSVYEIRSEFVSRAGTVWRAEAQFRSNENGTIGFATMAPISGSYSGIDATGLFWSMENTKERQTDASLFDNDDQSVITFTVRQGEESLASHRLLLRKRDIGISSTEIRDGITGTFYAPYNAHRLPAVVVLGGSEGGIPRDRAALIASHSYAVLALAYFGIGNLPSDLTRINVETVDRAVVWLRNQPQVNPNKIAILGVSKGAELALLSASRNSFVKAVVAIAPSSVVFQGVTQGGASSSWTIAGKEVPFAPFVRSEEYNRTRRLIDLYNPSLDAAPAVSNIPVEKISGPILMLAGKEDALWPSAKMASHIEERLRQHHFRFTVVNRTFDGAGHHVANIPLRPTADSVRLGGTAQALARVQIEAWREIVRFLNSSIGTHGSK